MKRCKVCKKKPKLERRVNCEGVVFCSDECYDQYDDSPNDFDHPYVDDYDGVRFEYMRWMREYEDSLFKGFYYGYPKKEQLIEEIDSVLFEFGDYYSLEGMDGVFSLEIYQYLLALEELQETIRKWELDSRKFNQWKRAMDKTKKEALLAEF